MTNKQKTAVPVAEHRIFTDESSLPTKAKIQTEEEFFQEAARELEEFRTGRRTPAIATVSFQSVAALLAVLTPKRYAIIETVKAHGRFDSIEALANELRRDRGTVSRDLKALTEAGLLQVQEAVHAGHGRRTEISSKAERLTVELTL